MADPEFFDSYIKVIPGNDDKTNKDISKDFCREFEKDSHIFYTSSSPEYKDINQIIPLISQENRLHFFRHRLEDIIVTAIKDNFEAIVIDLPPGFFGLSKSICEMNLEQIVRNLKQERNIECEPTRLDYLFNSIQDKDQSDTNIQGQVVFVSSADKPDYLALIPIFCNFTMDSKIVKKSFHYKKKKSKKKNNELSYKDLNENVNFIFNKLQRVRADPTKIAKEISDNLKKNKAAIQEKIKNYSDIFDLLETKPLKYGSLLFRLIPGFQMSDIIKIIKSIKSKKDENIKISESSMEGWCESTAKYFNLW
jgi:hypothetical protein